MKNQLSSILSLSVLCAFLCVFSCKKEDPCANKVCQNDGTCVSGACACAPGFEGDLCEKAKTPKAIVVKSVTVSKFPPFKPSLKFWDENPISNPDVFPVLAKGKTAIWVSHTFKTDVTTTVLPYKVIPNATLRITAINEKHAMELYDQDGSATSYEWMGGVEFTPANYLTGFPKTLLLDCANCTVAFALELEYEF